MAESRAATLTVTVDPSPTEQQQVIALVARAAAQDGHPAVNEAGLLALRRTDRDTDPAPLHVLAHDPDTGDLVGYAQAIGQESGPVAALVVARDRRRRGIGSALWRRLATETPGPLRVWASGDSPAARALAASEGLQPIRTLRVLARSLGGDLPSAAPPAGISLRTFRPGLDEEEWLAVNARAFALHPEQGSLTRADLEQREAEPWFDPDGFFVAVRDEPGDGLDRRLPLDQARARFADGRGVRDRCGPRRGRTRSRHPPARGRVAPPPRYRSRRGRPLRRGRQHASSSALPPVRLLPRHRRRHVRRPGSPGRGIR